MNFVSAIDRLLRLIGKLEELLGGTIGNRRIRLKLVRPTILNTAKERLVVVYFGVDKFYVSKIISRKKIFRLNYTQISTLQSTLLHLKLLIHLHPLEGTNHEIVNHYHTPRSRHETPRNETKLPTTEQFHRHLSKVRHTQRPYPLRYGSKGAWTFFFVPRRGGEGGIVVHRLRRLAHEISRGQVLTSLEPEASLYFNRGGQFSRGGSYARVVGDTRYAE